ncbi:MAG: hypothetical protein WD651_01505 [Acidimicrobiia bacterium]
MADPAEPTRYAFEQPDEAGYPDRIGTLSQDQAVLIDGVIDDPHAPAFDFYVVNDEKTGINEAIVDDTEIADLQRRRRPRLNRNSRDPQLFRPARFADRHHGDRSASRHHRCQR